MPEYVMTEKKVYKGKVLEVGAPAPEEWAGKPFTKAVKEKEVKDTMVKAAPKDKAAKKKGGKK